MNKKSFISKNIYNKHLCTVANVILIGFWPALISQAQSADFTISNGQTLFVPQILNDNEAGIIEDNGTLSVSSDHGVILDGNNTTLQLDGTIESTGNNVAFYARDQTTSKIVIHDGGLITSSAFATAWSTDGANSFLIDNAGTIQNEGTGGAANAVLQIYGELINRETGKISSNKIGVYIDGFFVDDPSTAISTINNMGIIESLGTTSAIHSNGVGGKVHVVNSGVIRTTGTTAISFLDADDLLEIQAGSIITGIVDGGDDTDTLRFGGTGDISFDLSTIGVDYINFENFEVREGTTSFSGTTSESFTVQDTASLKGTGTFGGLTFNSGSFLKPGNSIGTINTGSLTLNAGSTLEIEVGNTSGDSDKIIVTGAVDVTGSNLQVKENFTTYTGSDLTYTIIENDGVDAVTGTFDTITNDLAFMSASVDYAGDTGNDIVLILSGSGSSSSFADLTGTDTNQKSVGAALDQLSTSTGSAGETLRNLLMPLTTSQAQQTFTDLTGQIHSSATNNMFDVGGNIGEQIAGRFANLGQSSINGVGYTAALQSLNSNSSNQNYFATDLAISTTKIDSEEFGVGYTDASAAQSKIQFWGGVTGYYANTDNDGNTVGTHSSGYGVVLGGDKVIGTNTYGAAFGYGASKIQSNDNLSTMNVDSFSAALYGQRELDNDITFNGSANYTNHQIKGDRIISNINLTAQSTYTAHQLSIQGELAKRYTADHNKDVIPFVIGSFSHISTGGYIETGAGGANLVSTGRNDNNINLIVGARMEIELQEKTKLMLGAGYSHRFGDDTSDATYSFAGGGSFTTKGLKQNRHSAYLEASFEKAFSDTTTLFAKTSGNLTTGHQSIGGNVGFRVKF
jgi:outer membrane autotransporter protein